MTPSLAILSLFACPLGRLILKERMLEIGDFGIEDSDFLD
jgi:hypothetical protein